MKVHAILGEVYKDLPDQMIEMALNYKKVEAIFNSKSSFIVNLNSDISEYNFSVEKFIAKFKVDSGDTIGWVAVQLT